MLVALMLVGSPCHGQMLRLHGKGAVGRAVGGHQQRELSWGGTARVGAELVIVREFGILLEGSGSFLGSGELPSDRALAPLDGATGYSAAAGVHLRPFARRTHGKTISPAGLWLGGDGGFCWTAELRRPMVSAGLGFDFLFSRARVGVGPMLGWEHVFQPNDQLRPADANLFFAGIHGMFEPFATGNRIDGDQDKDKDGIRDSLDACPTEPEDKDGFADSDGCPDRDHDMDAIQDPDDRCPLVPEDLDKFEDTDGCPEADNDQDGIPDPSDKCPNDAEDKDEFEDEDGCPDRDDDQDGIPDREDLCPKEPETMNGYADQDGCPDAEQIRVVGDKIVLDDRVHYMINSHIIRNVSYPLLTRLAELIKAHPEYVHIEIQGHTDERGPDWYNERLSQTRADSAMAFLVAQGIAKDRLSAKGYGKSRPLVQKQTEQAYYMNRRVEIEITREIRQKIEPADATQPAEATRPTDASKPADASKPTAPAGKSRSGPRNGKK